MAALLGSLPSDFPACIALVQHVPRGFTEAFADYLKGATSLAVVVCRGIVPVAPATVVVAPGDQHLVATSRSHFGLSLAGSPAEYCPCGDVLLASLATVHGPAAAGVVLSGMGQDGAAGLAHLARRDALTLVQDEPSSTVNGMPRAAERAAVAVLTPEQMKLDLSGITPLAHLSLQNTCNLQPITRSSACQKLCPAARAGPGGGS